MSGRTITALGMVLFLGGAIASVLGGLGISDAARTHHFALLAGGIPVMTVGGLILWVQRFGID